jgi:protein gp37
VSTGIEWTDQTWNPVVGCTAVSPGCDICYAAVVASRQMQPAHRGLTIGRQWNGTVRLLPERLDEPLRWRNARRVFVCSMSDLFHRAVPEGFIVDVWTTMAMAPQHTFQVLTKRPKRMAHRLSRPWFDSDVEMGLRLVGYGRHVDWQSREYPEAGDARWLPNVWLGTSIESDRYTYRADHLRATPAAVRFLSLEPLLGALPSLDLTGIDWVIVGGESGSGARPMHPDWGRDIRDRCAAAGVPLFVKQLSSGGQRVIKDLDAFPEDLRIREWPDGNA